MTNPEKANITGSITPDELRRLGELRSYSRIARQIIRGAGSLGRDGDFAVVAESGPGYRKPIAYVRLDKQQMGDTVAERNLAKFGLPPVEDGLSVLAAQDAERLNGVAELDPAARVAAFGPPTPGAAGERD